MKTRRAAVRVATALLLASLPLPARAEGKEGTVDQATLYRTITIDGLSIFYREAGPKDAPTLLLLHGVPSSSRMFEPLFSRLSDRYHLVAPDYPGFGHSDWPDPKKFAYTFDHLAEVMNHFTEALGLKRYTLYMQDYGGPVGFRMALAHPDRVEALIVQDAVAHDDRPRRELGDAPGVLGRPRGQRGRAAHEPPLARRRRERATSGAIRTSRATTRTSGPTNSRFLNAPGQADIQSDLFYDYRTNVASYPKWQAWMRETKAAPPRDLGQVRALLRQLGAGGLPPRRALGGGPHRRRRAFRARHRGRRDRPARPRLPEVGGFGSRFPAVIQRLSSRRTL